MYNRCWEPAKQWLRPIDVFRAVDMRKTILLLPLLLVAAMLARAQDLSHLSLTSGGDAPNEMNYILGEVLVFQLTDGNIFIDGGTIIGGGELPDGIMEIVKERQDCGLVNCYPNPVHHQITVNFEGVENVTHLLVINELGQAVLQLRPVTTNVTFNVQELPAGAYYVALLDGKKLLCANKFVKQ